MNKPSVLSRKLVKKLNDKFKAGLDPEKTYIQRTFAGKWRKSAGEASFMICFLDGTPTGWVGATTASKILYSKKISLCKRYCDFVVDAECEDFNESKNDLLN